MSTKILPRFIHGNRLKKSIKVLARLLTRSMLHRLHLLNKKRTKGWTNGSVGVGCLFIPTITGPII